MTTIVADDREDSPSRRGMIKQLRQIERLGFQVIIAATACIAIYAASLWSDKTLYVSALLFSLLLASTISGGLLGFIFGIPRFLRQGDTSARTSTDGQGSLQSKSDNAYRSFAGNTNLEEISDWLTKIIVGIGLVQANKFVDAGRTLTQSFVESVEGAKGSGAIFVSILLIGLVGGFLFFYIQTRTRITLLLTDADLATGGGGPVTIAKSETDASIEARTRGARPKELPLSSDTSSQAVNNADKKLLDVPFEQLKSADEFGAWGAAQARAGHIQAGLKSIQEAISRDPGDPRYLSMLADVRLTQNNVPAAIDALIEARAKSPDNEAELLRQELLTSLYLEQPRSFHHALEIGEKLLKQQTDAAKDPMVQLWMAAAYGQQYDWLKRNAGQEADLATARSGALERVREVIRLEPDSNSPVRQILSSIFELGQNDRSGDNDLAVFRGDAEFEMAINGKPVVEAATQTEVPARRLGEESE